MIGGAGAHQLAEQRVLERDRQSHLPEERVEGDGRHVAEHAHLGAADTRRRQLGLPLARRLLGERLRERGDQIGIERLARGAVDEAVVGDLPVEHAGEGGELLVGRHMEAQPGPVRRRVHTIEGGGPVVVVVAERHGHLALVRAEVVGVRPGVAGDHRRAQHLAFAGPRLVVEPEGQGRQQPEGGVGVAVDDLGQARKHDELDLEQAQIDVLGRVGPVGHLPGEAARDRLSRLGVQRPMGVGTVAAVAGGVDVQQPGVQRRSSASPSPSLSATPDRKLVTNTSAWATICLAMARPRSVRRSSETLSFPAVVFVLASSGPNAVR